MVTKEKASDALLNSENHFVNIENDLASVILEDSSELAIRVIENLCQKGTFNFRPDGFMVPTRAVTHFSEGVAFDGTVRDYSKPLVPVEKICYAERVETKHFLHYNDQVLSDEEHTQLFLLVRDENGKIHSVNAFTGFYHENHDAEMTIEQMAWLQINQSKMEIWSLIERMVCKHNVMFERKIDGVYNRTSLAINQKYYSFT